MILLGKQRLSSLAGSSSTPPTCLAAARCRRPHALSTSTLVGSHPDRQNQVSRCSTASSAAHAAVSRATVCHAVAEKTAPVSNPDQGDARSFAVTMAQIADAVKAEDISVLHVEPLVSWCSYMVLCTVMSRPQLLAVLARMEDAAQQDWDRVKQNSAGTSQWEVMDFGDVVVQIFTAEQRELYDLDGFYAAAEEVELPFIERAWGSRSSRDGSSDSEAATGGSSQGPVWSKSI
eukprot:GHRR01012122.1.p1 GENE.GHRR01012122.1~~GHRR01012122.1.p1  ORF type:complete len:233 (+),score=64.67 GHRR01012122.1:527-1225(+)